MFGQLGVSGLGVLKSLDSVEGLRFKVGYCPPQQQLDKEFIIGLYIALNRTPNIDCYWVGAVPKFKVLQVPK